MLQRLLESRSGARCYFGNPTLRAKFLEHYPERRAALLREVSDLCAKLDCLVSLMLGTQGYGFRYADRIAITPAHASLRPEDRRRGNPVRICS